MPSVTPADVKPVGVVTGQLAQEHAAWCFLNGRNGWWLVHTAHVFCSLAEGLTRHCLLNWIGQLAIQAICSGG